MSSTWSSNNEKSLIKSIIKNERTEDDEIVIFQQVQIQHRHHKCSINIK
jgi:hypothetical protein